jgi:hypothetical protein
MGEEGTLPSRRGAAARCDPPSALSAVPSAAVLPGKRNPDTAGCLRRSGGNFGAARDTINHLY